jgi:cytosine/adenosine deaminase-related metal-dependent hydrolase
MSQLRVDDILIVTMDKELKCLVGTIGIGDDGRIQYVGPSKPLPPVWAKARRIRLPRKCLALPGFLDGHVHVTYLPWRYDGNPSRERFNGHADPGQKRGVIHRIRSEAVSAGVTFLADFAPYDDGVLYGTAKTLGLAEVVKDLLKKGLTGFVLVRLPEDPGSHVLNVKASKRHLEEALDLVRSHRNRGLYGVFVHLPVERKGEYSHAVLTSYRRVLKPYRNRDDLWIHAHCCESAMTARHAASTFGGHSSIEVLDRFGLLCERTLLAHCIHVSCEDLRLVRKREARVLTVPKFKDGRLARVGRMLDMGIPVALCSDTYAIDPFNRMTQGYHLHRRFAPPGRNSRELKARELLRMATIGAAEVFELQGETGSIEVGKRADIVLVDMAGKIFDPFWNPDFWCSGRTHGRDDWLKPIEKVIECGCLSCRDVRVVLIGGREVYSR